MFEIDDIITGEKFLTIADYVFSNQDIISFHRNIFNFCHKDKLIIYDNNFNIKKEDFKKINNTNNTNNTLKFFVYGCHLLSFLNNILDKINIEFILIVHNSDENIIEKYISYFDNKKIIKIFSQNIDIEHQKLNYLPIGIANSQWQHGNLNIIKSVINLNLQKDKLVYFNFSVSNAYKTRPYLYNLLINKSFEFTKNQNFEKYLTLLSQHKFTFSPNGGGVDCHRTWEALYLGVIPILEKSILADKLEKDYPILVVEDWKIITKDFLETEYLKIKLKTYDNNKLRFNYFITCF